MFRYMLNGMFTAHTLRKDDAGADAGGGTDDRGDNWEPTDAAPPANADGHQKEGDDTGKDNGLADKLAREQEAAEKEAKEKEAKDKPSLKDDTVVDDPTDLDDKEGKEGKEGKADKRADTRMPLSRHKEILEKERAERRAIEQRLAQFEQGSKITVINESITKAENDVTTLDAKYAEQIANGEHKDAAETSREIRKLEREIADKKVQLASQAAESRAYEKVRYDSAVERLEAAYPSLNPEHDEYDKDSTQDVLDLASTYRRRGVPPYQAIQDAAKKLLGAATKKQEAATEVKPRVSEEDAAEVARAARKAAQVDKNLKTQAAQPASTAKVGADSDKAGGGIRAADVMKMTEKDFNSLDEETLARMRGDTL